MRHEVQLKTLRTRLQKSAEVEHKSRVCRLTSQESPSASVLQLAFSTSAFSDLSQSTVLLAILNSQKSISCCTSLLLSPPASAAKQNGTQAPSTVCCTSPYNMHYTSENHVSYSTAFVASSNKELGSLLEREAAYRHEAGVENKWCTEDKKRAAAKRLAARA